MAQQPALRLRGEPQGTPETPRTAARQQRGPTKTQHAVPPDSRANGDPSGHATLDLRQKIAQALKSAVPDACIRLDVDADGVLGEVVSPRFKRMSSAARTRFIDDLLRHPSVGLSLLDRRQVVLISAHTPEEFDWVGRRIQVSRVRERAGGAVEVVVFGHLSDAQHVREAVNGRSGVRTTEPKPVDCAPGVLISFRAKGTATKPLTRDKVLRLLKGDTFIELLPNA